MSDDDNVFTKTTTIVDWTLAVFAIFWGVWWTTIYEVAVKNSAALKEKAPLLLTPEYLSTTVPIIAALYTYICVMWMWKTRRLPWTLDFWKKFWIFFPIVVSVFGFICFYYSLCSATLITFPQYMYGSLLSALWVFVTTIIIYTSKGWGS